MSSSPTSPPCSPPSPSASPSAAAAAVAECDAALKQLYATHAPEKLANLPTLKAKYGSQLLLAKARAKYLGTPSQGGGAASGGTCDTSRVGSTGGVGGVDRGAMAVRRAMMAAETAKLSTLLAAGAARRTSARALLHTATGRGGHGGLGGGTDVCVMSPLADHSEDPLHDIIVAGDTVALQALHGGEAGPLDLSRPWSRRNPALCLEVAQRGHAEMLGWMIQQASSGGEGSGNVDLRVLSSTSRTVLMLAALAGHESVVRVLLESSGGSGRSGRGGDGTTGAGGGALTVDVNAQSGFDRATALHLCQDVGAARLLVQQGADWRMTNMRGHSVLEAAIDRAYAGTIDLRIPCHEVAAAASLGRGRISAAATPAAAPVPTGHSRAAVGPSPDVAAWLRRLDAYGTYRGWLASRRMPLLYLHRLALSGRATQQPQPQPQDGSSSVEGDGDATRLATALAFVFPGPATQLSLPCELLPRFVRAIVAPP